MKTALFCGSFDPFTSGHLHIVQKALEKFDCIIINVGMNDSKTPLFNTQERLNMVVQSLKDCALNDKVKVISDFGITADIALRENVSTLIRGIRMGGQDTEYEKNLAVFNQILGEVRGIKLTTEFILEDDEFLQNVSSTHVKNLCFLHEYIAASLCVTPFVHQKLMEKFLQKVFKKLSRSKQSEVRLLNIYDSIIASYAARYYHNISHIAYMLNMLNIYCAQNHDNVITQNYHSLILAIFMHDYVYSPQSKVNEEKSAQALDNIIQNDPRVFNPFIKQQIVQELILATKHHENAKTQLQALMSDLDLSILGTSNPVVWNEYTLNIRKEFLNYSDTEYRTGRILFLKSLIERPQIFQTVFFHKLYEKQARENISREIQKLS